MSEVLEWLLNLALECVVDTLQSCLGWRFFTPLLVSIATTVWLSCSGRGRFCGLAFFAGAVFGFTWEWWGWPRQN
jgi:hypothetical protein